MAIKVIPPGQEESFLKALPIREMWGIGPKSEKLLNDFGIVTIGDIQGIQVEKLKKLLGNFAYTLKKRALGVDNRKVENNENVKSVSNERTFFNHLKTKREILSVLKGLSEKVGWRLPYETIHLLDDAPQDLGHRSDNPACAKAMSTGASWKR